MPACLRDGKIYDGYFVFFQRLIKEKSKLNVERSRKKEKETNAEGTINNPVIYGVFCFDVTQGCMKGAPNETRTHSVEKVC